MTPVKKSHTGAIVGGVVGGLGGIALVVVAAIFLVTRHKRNQTNAPTTGENNHQSMSNVQPPPASNYGGASPMTAAAVGAGAGMGAGAAVAHHNQHNYKYGGPETQPPSSYYPPSYPPSNPNYHGAPTVSSEAQSDMSPPGSVAPGYNQHQPGQQQGFAGYPQHQPPTELPSTEARPANAPQELPTSPQ